MTKITFILREFLTWQALLDIALIAVGLLFFHLPSIIRMTVAAFDGAALPPAAKPDDDIDPFAALREFEYKGPTLGDGGGTPGKGPGGVPTAAGTTPTEYKASIAAADQSAANGGQPGSE